MFWKIYLWFFPQCYYVFRICLMLTPELDLDEIGGEDIRVSHNTFKMLPFRMIRKTTMLQAVDAPILCLTSP